jgi:outer membrane protein insertion porin family
VWGVSVALRAEQVTLSRPQDLFNDGITQEYFPLAGPTGNVEYYSDTAQELLNERGSHFLTSIKPAVVRDTTDSQVFPTTGSRTSVSLEQYGVLGGDVDITKFVLGFNWYTTLYTDLFDRKTVLSLRNELGVIPFGTSPTYERFYLGGIGELRGFKFRGISPRSGPLNDPIGGDFEWMTTAEVNYPIYEDMLRGVVFVDIGTVESDITITSIRSDVGAGIRLTLPLFGGLPIAVDFAYPVTKKSGDRTQWFAISLGMGF